MRKVAVVAGGISRFDLPRLENQEEMVAEAMKAALADCPNLELSDIDTVIASYFADHFEQQLACEWIIHDYLGLTPKPLHEKSWIDDIVKRADDLHIPVFIKSNAHYHAKSLVYLF